MVFVKEIANYIEERFPTCYSEDFDNVGLMLGRGNAPVSRVLLCLDVTSNVVREAIKHNAELIISHHPAIFTAQKSITEANAAPLLLAAENGIAIYSAHTNLDSAPEGLADYAVKKLGLVPQGAIVGNLGRICPVNDTLYASELCARIKKAFGVKKLYSTLRGDRLVKKIAVCNGGGGGEVLCAAMESGADIYISGDLKHHEHTAIGEKKDFDYIELRHYDSEFCVTALMYDVLCEKFGCELDVLVSKENVNPCIDTDEIL